VGDLADVASVGVHREDSALGLLGIEVAPKDDLTIPASTTVRALVVFVIVSATGRAMATITRTMTIAAANTVSTKVVRFIIYPSSRLR
jgi:hypothetical protein